VTKKSKNRSRSKKASSSLFTGVPGWSMEHYAGAKSSTTNSMPMTMYKLPSACKFMNNDAQIAAASFLHLDFYSFPICNQIVQGTGDNNRIGDFAHLLSCSLSLAFDSTGATAPAIPFMVRVMLVASTVQSSSAFTTGGLTTAQVFYNPGIGIHSTPDHHLVKVLKDEIIQVNSGGQSVSLAYASLSAKLNTRFEYLPGSQYGINTNLYWILYPFVAGGASNTTKVCTVDFAVSTAFKDV